MSNKNLIVNTPEPKPGILERGDLFAIAVGMVIGSGMVTLIGPAMAMTGYSVWLAYLTAIVMGFFMVFPYIILGGTMRVAGGPYSIVTNLSGVSAGGLVAYTKLVTPILNSSFALALGLYVNNLLPGITVKAIAVVGICILFVLNLLGMDIFAKVSKILSTILLITMVLYVVFGLTQIKQPIFQFSGDKMFTGGFKGFMLAALLLINSANGYYNILWYGKDAKKATKDVPFASMAFHYDSGCSYTLSRIVTKVMGKNCLALMQERVFDKMGFGEINWLTSPEGHNTGGWGMYLTAGKISALAQLLLQKGEWNGEQLIPAWWTEEIGKMRVVIPEDEKKALTHYAYHIKAGKEIFAAEGAFGQYLICFRDYPVAIGITAGASEYLAADICLKYIKEAVQIPCEKENLEEAQEKLEEKLVHLTLPKPEGDKKDTNEATKKLLNKRIVFTENPRQIESAVISTVGEELKLELTVAGEKKILFAGYKDWKCNDMYPNDFTKRYHAVSYAFDEDALYLSVGLLNTSYREEYCLWVNSENVVVGTWRPNVTYLPAEEDMTWKFTGTFEPSCIL